MIQPPSINWANDFSQYVMAMTRGQGYGGEAYWDEEESALKEYFGSAPVKRSLSVGCGLFRELETLKQITTEEVVGLEYEQQFIDYLAPRIQSDASPHVSLLKGDICHDTFDVPKFDLVMVLFNTLGVLHDIPQALANMHAMLRSGGTLWISTWMDTEEITGQRKKLYTSFGDKVARIEKNTRYDFYDIVAYKNDVPVHRSAIFTKDYLINALKLLPGTEIQIKDFHYSRVAILRKTS